MKTQDTPAPAVSASDAGIILHNRLYPGHRYQAAMDEVFRGALRDLPGPWEVLVTAPGRAWFRIEITALDGAIWSMAVPVREGPRGEDLADMVRVACIRHSRLQPDAAKRETGRPGDSADDAGGARSKALQPRAQAVRPTSREVAGGTPK